MAAAPERRDRFVPPEGGGTMTALLQNLSRHKTPRSRSGRPGGLIPRVESLEGRALLAAFAVTNIGDAGPGSLRQAILDANATPGVDAITFDIPGPGAHSIAPASPLPPLSDPV